MLNSGQFPVKKEESPYGLSSNERDDNYCTVVHLEGHWRVIICKNSIQWIIQYAKKAGTERRWYGSSYVKPDAPVGREDWAEHPTFDAAFK